MGQIQSSVGLVTGVQIQDTVDKLMKINALPRNRLANRTTGLTKEQSAVTTLTTLVIGVQLTTDRLGSSSLFNGSQVSSSKPDVLSAASTGKPAIGTYSFIPVRQAQSQQISSSLLAAPDQKLSAGTLTINTGGFLDQTVQLDQLNGGAGVARGFIRITDRSGTSKEIDLRFAQTASDVINTINGTSGLSVVARLDAGHFSITDVSGSTASNLKIEDIGSGTTARDLGFNSVSIAGTVATGQNLTWLATTTSLRNLRDGLGLELPKDGPALRFRLRDGSEVNFSTNLDGTKASLGQLIDELNTAGTGKFRVRITNNGQALRVDDLTSGSSSFSISSPKGNLATQLGWSTADSPGVINGSRLLAGLGDTLLSSLNGGRGLGTLGSIKITDKARNIATVDLSTARTVNDVMRLLNSGAGSASYRVQLNATKTGIEIRDTSTGTGSLIVENNDSTNTADLLQIRGTTTSTSINSGSLNRQFVGLNTSISEFLGGDQTLSKSSFKITDSQGRSASFNVAARNPKTIGDLIEGINGLGISVEARINDTGDGIVLVDTGSGTGTMSVTEIGTGKAASQLRILGTAGSVRSRNATVSGIDGSKTIKISTTSSTTVEELVTKINELTNAPVQANLVNLGNSGVRLQLNGKFTGAQSRVAVSSDLNISFTQTSEARDALVSFGANEVGGGVLVGSSSNTFTSLVKDLSITVNGTSTTPITVKVQENNEALTNQLQAFVDQYNKLRDKYDELTTFDSNSGNIGLLFGSAVAGRIEQAYSQLLTAPIRNGSNGAIRSLPELGVKMGDKGKLSFDKAQFQKVLEANPAAVRDFLSNETNGFSKKAKEVADSLAGVENGALIARNKALQNTIEANNARIGSMDQLLDKQRNRLLKQFYAMETAISKFQANLSSISSVQSLSNNLSRSSR